MPLTQSELLDLVDDVNVAVAQVIASYAELSEGMVDDAATDAAKTKVERLKSKTDAAKKRLADLKDRQRHKRELEKLRKQRDKSAARPTTNEGKNTGMVTLRAASGRVVGYMRATGKDRTDFYSAAGKLVAREVGGVTYDGQGKMVYRGKMGLVVLGRSL
jgi:fructose-1,6-bisphosphatase/inositol monophosphatase family enzyme